MRVTIDNDTIMEIFKRAGYCRRKDDDRPGIQGIQLTPSHDKIQAVATDGHRLAVWNPLGPKEQTNSVVVHGPVLDFLWRHRAKVETLIIEYRAGKQHPIKISMGEAGTVEFDLAQGEFPPHDHVIPKHHDAAITGEVRAVRRGLGELKRAGLKDMFLLTDEGKLWFYGHENKQKESEVYYRTRIEVGKVEEYTRYNEDPYRSGFNLQYFYECIRSLKQDTFTIKLQGYLDPVVVETDDSAHVIMPMRI